VLRTKRPCIPTLSTQSTRLKQENWNQTKHDLKTKIGILSGSAKKEIPVKEYHMRYAWSLLNKVRELDPADSK
jgi:hypothetical protein